MPDDALVLQADRGQTLFALDVASGALRWRHDDAAGFAATPALVGGRVFIGSGRSFHPSLRQPGTLWAIAQGSGEVLWRQTCAAELAGDPAVIADRVVVGGNDGVVRALRVQDGRQLWQVATSGFVTAQPVSADGERVWVGSCDGWLRALRMRDGGVVHEVALGGAVTRRSAVTADGVVAVTQRGVVVALDSDGRRRWDADVGGSCSAPVLHDGRVFVGAGDAERGSAGVYVLDLASGRRLGSVRSQGWVRGAPCVVDSVLYFASTDMVVRAVDVETLVITWVYGCGGQVYASPAVRAGRVFVAAQNALHVLAQGGTQAARDV